MGCYYLDDLAQVLRTQVIEVAALVFVEIVVLVFEDLDREWE